MANDPLSTLKSYISKVAGGEHTPAEVANSVNAWLRENTESVKIKVEEEVTRSVSKMGFIKRAEFDELLAEVAALRAGSATAPDEKKSSKGGVSKAKKKTSPKKSATGDAAKIEKPAKPKSSKAGSLKKKVAATKPVKPSAKPAGKVK